MQGRRKSLKTGARSLSRLVRLALAAGVRADPQSYLWRPHRAARLRRARWVSNLEWQQFVAAGWGWAGANGLRPQFQERRQSPDRRLDSVEQRLDR